MAFKEVSHTVPPDFSRELLTAVSRTCVVGVKRRKYSASSVEAGKYIFPYSNVSSHRKP